MSSKKKILSKLRQGTKPFADIELPEVWQTVAKVADTSPDGLRMRFREEAEKVGCFVYPAEDEQEAINQVMRLIDEEKFVLAWDDEHLPVAKLLNVLKEHGIEVAAHDDANVLVGLTGADVALAASGSMILKSGKGKHRLTSLLPDKHIAIVRTGQIVADMEAWVKQERQNDFPAFKENSNTTIVSGPSKTGDIGQVLVKGAHGPREVHIVLLDE